MVMAEVGSAEVFDGTLVYMARVLVPPEHSDWVCLYQHINGWTRRLG